MAGLITFIGLYVVFEILLIVIGMIFNRRFVLDVQRSQLEWCLNRYVTSNDPVEVKCLLHNIAYLVKWIRFHLDSKGVLCVLGFCLLGFWSSCFG